MIGHILMMSLAGTVLSTEILFDFPNPTEPRQITKFFTIQYVTSTVALSPQTVTETVNPTCTITASSIPVCGEASVGIIFTSGGILPVRQDVTPTESVSITTSTAMISTVEGQRTDDEETTTFWSVKVDQNDMNDEETTTSWSVKVDKNDMKNEETTPSWSVKVDEKNMEEEVDDSMTTTAPLSRSDLTESETEEYEYSEVDTTTIMYDDDEDISNHISNDGVSSSSNSDMSIENSEEITSVTNIDSTEDIEIMSILNEINLSPQTSTVPLENIQTTITEPGAAVTRTNAESNTAYIPLATSVQPNLPLSTSYEMATVVLPSCDCASNRQPRNEDMADIITFMTTKTVNTPTITVTGTAMHTIQYAGCLPEDAVVTSSCV